MPLNGPAGDEEDGSCVLSPPQSVYLRLWHRILGVIRVREWGHTNNRFNVPGRVRE